MSTTDTDNTTPAADSAAAAVPNWRSVDAQALTGRALDVAVAGAMGWTYFEVFSNASPVNHRHRGLAPGGDRLTDVPRYTYCEALWSIVMDAFRRGWEVTLRPFGEHGARMTLSSTLHAPGEVTHEAITDTPAVALCRAFVAARQAEERGRG